MPKGKELNERQKLFISEYIIDRNATQSAIRAGYSEKTAYAIGNNLLKKIEIKNAIDEKLDKMAKKLDLTAEKILMDIEEVKRRCLQGEEILDREGNSTGEWRFDASNALKACELQGRHLKMFTDRTEVEQSGEVIVNFNIPRPKG